MRHRVYGKKLGRNTNERTGLFKSLVQQLLLHGTITTTQAKAKAIKGQVDKIINLAKSKDTRKSGHTQLIRLGARLGDQAMMVKMSLIGAEELKPLEKVTSNKAQVANKK